MLTAVRPAGAFVGLEVLDNDYAATEPLDSFGLCSTGFENEWELARSWEWENMGT